MCGIAGFIDRAKDFAVLSAMTQAIARRGPDDCGYYHEDGVGLGHRRLSIIDLSPCGHQPMRFENLVMVFNGEIYNYREVREQLAELGYSFTSSSDTEVVLKAFHRWGPDCMQRFIGMFAMAIHDRREKATYLIRDRVGVKPLYWYCKEGRLAFGSELRALHAYLSPEERSAINTAATSNFLALGYVGGDLSILDAVQKVPAAHYVRFCGGEATLHRYWDVQFRENPDWLNRSEDDLLDEMQELMISAFRYRMVADVPIGVFLSSGVDSSLVTSVLARHHGQLRTFTIGFKEAGYDESADARKIAEHLGTEHTDRILSPDAAQSILARLYDVYDEPFGDSSCVPTVLVSQLARDSGVKVVLSADGGDELFGGYTRYIDYPRRWNQIRRLGALGRGTGRLMFAAAARFGPPARGERQRRFAGILSRASFTEFMQTMMRQFAIADYRLLLPGFQDQLTEARDDPDLLSAMSQWDFENYLPNDILVKVDRATMYHSIEGREPFLDHRLVEFAAQLPTRHKIRGSEGKYLLKELLGRYLPEHLYRLPKRGFAAPWATWVRDSFEGLFVQTLDEGVREPFDPRGVERLLDRFRRGEPLDYTVLWYLFSYHAWYRQWIATGTVPDQRAA